MNRHQQTALNALRGLPLGNLTEHPIVKMTLRYWWLSIPVGVALYGRYKAQLKDTGSYKLYNAFDDFGSIMGPIMTFVGLSEMAHQMERQGVLREAPGIRDAEYESLNTAQEQ